MIWGLQPGPLLFEQRFRLGPDRVDVPGQHRGADRGADLRAALRRDPARAVLVIAPIIMVICAIGSLPSRMRSSTCG